jgi:amino acid transporter
MFYNATQSYAASDVMTVVLIINNAASGVAALAAASRQLWAFARSRGVPFSYFFAPVRTLFSASQHWLTSLLGTSCVRYPSQFNSLLSIYIGYNHPHQCWQ